MASENRVGPHQFQTMPWTNTQAATAIAKGELFALSGNRCGFALEAIGTNGQSRSTTYPGGNSAAVCIASELAVVDKNATTSGATFSPGDAVYFDSGVVAGGVIDGAQATTSTFIVGLAAASATTSDATVEVASFHGGAPDTN